MEGKHITSLASTQKRERSHCLRYRLAHQAGFSNLAVMTSADVSSIDDNNEIKKIQGQAFRAGNPALIEKLSRPDIQK